MKATIISIVCLLLVLGLSNSIPHIPSSRDALHAFIGDLHESQEDVIPGKNKEPLPKCCNECSKPDYDPDCYNFCVQC